MPRTITLRLTEGPTTFTAVTPLTVDNVAPTATDLRNDGPVPEGSTATVTVTGQDDPSADDLAALVYSYDFDDDGTFDLTSSLGVGDRACFVPRRRPRDASPCAPSSPTTTAAASN